MITPYVDLKAHKTPAASHGHQNPLQDSQHLQNHHQHQKLPETPLRGIGDVRAGGNGRFDQLDEAGAQLFSTVFANELKYRGFNVFQQIVKDRLPYILKGYVPPGMSFE